mmetsp:Transcript_15848/g.13457  ORF Transcript_15848/g.13457 Transcript_15848/m.13457 type:complete len:87 (-) Transcript_15848:36-296(-)
MIWDIAKRTYMNEGLRGLYQGIGIATIGSAPALALFFTSYEMNKYYMDKFNLFKETPNFQHFLCGLGAEIISCIFWVPIDVIKERL